MKDFNLFPNSKFKIFNSKLVLSVSNLNALYPKAAKNLSVYVRVWPPALLNFYPVKPSIFFCFTGTRQ
jgi:hypothetical protein